ncbi:MAG: UDP-N-acetylmuramoyl-L-alanine--D-glutamate ligase [Bacilli bacterium]|nr:UDP-N-acetylmuramoyl-L-alanine--D-glutamate ligase [Bacilli bacterium]
MKISYLLLGYGKSNQSIKRFFDLKNISYQIYDDFQIEYRKNLDFNSFKTIIKSPGIKNDHYILDIARKLNKEIISDLELFYRFNRIKNLICVTGTNGKTTTVNLIKHLLPNLDLCGNVGDPLFDYCDSPRDAIIEASSFMAEYLQDFKARINVFLNIKPHHLDHHRSFEEYFQAKLKILKNVRVDDFLIYNDDDLFLREAVRDIATNKIPFSKSNPSGFLIKERKIFYQGKEIFNDDGLKLLGEHNLENIAAAFGASRCYQKDFNDFGKVKTFTPLPHRLEYLGMIGKTKIYNDSKSTNLLALKTSLATFEEEKVVLICGGKNALNDYSSLDDNLDNIKMVLINGENKDAFRSYFQKHKISTFTYPTLEALMSELIQYLEEEAILLFSPGAVSYDQFSDFEARGNFFKEKIKSLLNKVC